MSESMNLPNCQVSGCGRTCPPGMTVCGQHADQLRWELHWLPRLAAALESARLKEQNFARARLGGLVHTDEAPIPFNPRASETELELTRDLTTAADGIAAARGLHRPMDDLRMLGPWLAEQVTWIRSRAAGGQQVEYLVARLRWAWRAVDAPPEMTFLGPCGALTVGEDQVPIECSADLYGVPGRPEVQCRECGTTVPVADRREWLLSKAEDRLLPASEMARAVRGLGVDVTPSVIRKWAERGRLTRKGIRPMGGRQIPVYRVGDVLDLVSSEDRRRHERPSRERAKGAS